MKPGGDDGGAAGLSAPPVRPTTLGPRAPGRAGCGALCSTHTPVDPGSFLLVTRPSEGLHALCWGLSSGWQTGRRNNTGSQELVLSPGLNTVCTPLPCSAGQHAAPATAGTRPPASARSHGPLVTREAGDAGEPGHEQTKGQGKRRARPGVEPVLPQSRCTSSSPRRPHHVALTKSPSEAVATSFTAS